MILNDISLQGPTVAAWVEEVDRRLTDATGHRMLAYGDEILVERRGRHVWMRIPWQRMADDLFAMAHPTDMHSEPTDASDFYLAHVAELVREVYHPCAGEVEDARLLGVDHCTPE